MTDHDDRASEDAVYTCQGCGATFTSQSELHLHNTETHGGGSTGGSDETPPGGRPDELPAGGEYVGS